MYAIVETGGRQYRVSPGDRIDVEKLVGEVGDTITLTDVLLVGNGSAVTVGTPKVTTARVEAQITAQKRGKKIIVFKFKRRKNYRKKQGHRQSLTSLQILGIHTDDATMPAGLAQESSEDLPGIQTDDATMPATAEVEAGSEERTYGA
jgi:large subunit ribosomal protein L21